MNSYVKKDNKGRNLRDGEDQRVDGRYRYRYFDQNGKRQSIYSWKLVPGDKVPKGKRECVSLREREAEIQRDLMDGINTYDASMSLNKVFEQYLSTKPMLAKKTIENYVSLWKNHIENGLGRMPVGKVKRSDILRLYGELYNIKKMAVGTLQILQNVLYPTFEMAVDDDVIRKNPCRNCMKPYAGIATKERKPLSRQQQTNLLDFLKNDSIYYYNYYTMFYLLLSTGMRISECLGITWKDIDFEKGVISINHQLVYGKVDGKYSFYIKEPKYNSIREVPLQESTKALLKDYRNDHYFVSRASGIKMDGYSEFVFLNSKSNFYKPETINRAINGIIKEYNNINDDEMPHFSAHTLRHTFCTRMAENGLDPKVLQKLMGHKNIIVTMEVYNHVDSERMKNAVEKLPDIMCSNM